MKFIFSLALQGPYVVWLLPASPAYPPSLLPCSTGPQQPFQREAGRLRSPGSCTCRPCSSSLSEDLYEGRGEASRQGAGRGGAGAEPAGSGAEPAGSGAEAQEVTAEPAESEESAPAAALRSRALGDGERRGLPSHHRGAPGPRQRRPERPRRLLHPEPALGVPATQNLGAGESAAGAGERRRRAAPCLRRRRPFPHPQFLPSPPGEGPFPAGEAPAPPPPGPLLEARRGVLGPPGVFGGRRKCAGGPSPQRTQFSAAV